MVATHQKSVTLEKRYIHADGSILTGVLSLTVVRDHDDRSLTGAVAPVVDRDGLVAALVAGVSGFGPLQPLLDDPRVEEVWINEPRTVR